MSASASIWRPPQWSTPKLTSITAKNPASSVSVTTTTILPGPDGVVTPNAGGTLDTRNEPAGSTTYFFDSEMSIDHYTHLRMTEHPVQSGAAIVDHAYMMPVRVVLEIGMSDAMDSFVHGQYAANASKSISAYQTFITLQKSRVPLQLSTRLQQYDNMLIEEIRAADTNQTAHGLKATIVLRQIILAQVATQTVSSRPDQTMGTNASSLQPTSVDPAVLLQHQKPPPALPPAISSDPSPPSTFNLGDMANVPPQ